MHMQASWEQITEALAQVGGEDPAIRGGILVGTGAVALGTLGLSAYRWLRRGPAPEPELLAATPLDRRVKVDIDAPEGTAIDLRVNGN